MKTQSKSYLSVLIWEWELGFAALVNQGLRFGYLFPQFPFFFFFFFFNFLSFVLFCFLELIMFCQWLHAKYLATQYQNISWPKNFVEYVFMLSLLLLPSFWLLFVLMLVACTVVLFFILSTRILLFHCCPVKLLEIRNCFSFFFTLFVVA